MGEPARKATAEEVCAAIKASEEARIRGEEALRKALRESHRKTEESLRKTQKELSESQKKTEEKLRKLGDSLKKESGNFNNKWGQFLENFLEGDFVKLLKGRGIQVNHVIPRFEIRRSGKVLAEYDFLAVNGKEVVLAEVKTTLEKDHVGKFIEKLEKFKGFVSLYKNHILYGAMGYMSIKNAKKDQSKKIPEYEDASKMAQDKGLFLVKAPGGVKDVSKMINEENFKPKAF